MSDQRLVDSTKQLIPVHVDGMQEYIMSTWTKELAKQQYGAQLKGSTLPDDVIRKAAAELAYIFEPHAGKLKLRVLEPFCGNGVASAILNAALVPFVDVWISTDILTPTSPSFQGFGVFKEMDAVVSVKEHPYANLLLLVAPPPAEPPPLVLPPPRTIPTFQGYGDYFACRDFIQQSTKRRYIVFIGELSAGDGSQGMLRYLTEHKQLTLVCRKELCRMTIAKLTLCKELFLFKTNTPIKQ